MALKALLVTVSVGHWLAAFAVSPQYVLVSDKKTWQGALDYCRRTHGDLASVKGPVEMGLLAAAAREEDVWIGLAANSRGLWSWSDGGGLSFTAWSFGEPSDTQSCGRVKAGFWYDEDCDNKYNFVCSSGLWTTTAASQTHAASTVAMNIPPLFTGDGASASQPIGEIPSAPLRDVSPAISFSLVTTDLASSSLGAMNSPPSSALEATTTTFTTSSEQHISSSSNHVQNTVSNHPPVAKTLVYIPSSEASFRLLPTPHKTEPSSAPAGLPYQILSPPTVPGVPVSTHLTPNGSLSPTPVSMKADSTHSPRSTSGLPTSSSTSSKTVRVAPDPRTASSKRGTAFHLNLELMPWIEARKYCRAVHSDLASVPTTDVQMAITELLAGSTAAQRGAWLGLRKNRFMGNWYWVNDEAFDFSYWHEGEPSNQVWEQCGMVSANPGRNFSWADECCAARLPAICYSEL